MKLIVDCRYVRHDRHDGISRYTIGLVRALSELTPVTMLISDERQLTRLPELPWVMGTDPTSLKEIWLARCLNPHEPDAVFSPMQTMGGHWRRYRLILTLHDLIYYRHRTPPRYFSVALRLLWRAYHLFYWPQRLVLARGDALVTGSETAREQILQARLAREPIAVVQSGVDPLPVGPEQREPILVYMGSFMPYKNVETLAAAMRELPGYTLHLLSRIRPREREHLERAAGEARLVFHDGVEDADYHELLGRASALLMPSRDEGFGIPIIEAMSAGTPVVCSDIPVFREVGGTVPIYCDPDSPEAFAAAVRLLEDPGERARRSRDGIERASGYRWEHSARRLYALVCELVGAVPQERATDERADQKHAAEPMADRG